MGWMNSRQVACSALQQPGLLQCAQSRARAAVGFWTQNKGSTNSYSRQLRKLAKGGSALMHSVASIICEAGTCKQSKMVTQRCCVMRGHGTVAAGNSCTEQLQWAVGLDEQQPISRACFTERYDSCSTIAVPAAACIVG